MLQRYIFWLKSNFGFSRKESRGFLLVVPILLIFYAAPRLVQKLNKGSWVATEQQTIVDSLLTAGWTWEESGPTFNRQDTVSNKAAPAPTGIQMIPFAQADSIVLQIVPGIGPTLAGRIIKYRDNLGGFHSKSQLNEVYGVKKEAGDLVWEYFEFQSVITNKLKINLSEIPEIATHPYINYGQAKVIVAYRDQHGPYMNQEDLKKIRIFTPDWISKIAPYLDFSTESN